jgi:SAM-dependent methyltransferase
MTVTPGSHYQRVFEAQTAQRKCATPAPQNSLIFALRLLRAIDGPLTPTMSVLDLGCGDGGGVADLVASGYDAYGVDVVEYWGKDAHLYWLSKAAEHSARTLQRLSLAAEDPYCLPFSAEAFDRVLSSEVLEHVDDRAAVFAEIARVLKPGGVSVHVFPGRWLPLIESHTGVPLAPLCKHDGWLKLAALLGIRNRRQLGMTCCEVYRSNRAQMKITHYASRRRILREAREAGLRARFAEADYVRRSGTGWTALYRRLSRFGLGGLAIALARFRLNAMLVLTRQPLQ